MIYLDKAVQLWGNVRKCVLLRGGRYLPEVTESGLKNVVFRFILNKKLENSTFNQHVIRRQLQVVVSPAGAHLVVVTRMAATWRRGQCDQYVLRSLSQLSGSDSPSPSRVAIVTLYR